MLIGEDALPIFSSAFASAAGFLVNSAEDASARYSLCLDTAIAMILERSGASRANKTIIRRISGCMPLLLELRLVLMPPYFHALTAQSDRRTIVPTSTVTTVISSIS